MYDELRRDHLELARLAGELLNRTGTAELTDAGGLGRCRWQLARALTRHLALEDAHVYARLDADPRPGVAAIARRYKSELCHLSDQFNDHMAQWTGDAIARDWAGYCRAVEVLLTALKTRVECEDKELYPLVAPKERAAA